MDGVCLRTGIHHHGINPSISTSGYLDARPSPSQVNAVGRASTGEKSLNTNLFSRFSFRYPLKSLWPVSGGRYNGLAMEDEMMLENGERVAIEEDGSEMGKNGNWILKILHVRSLWREKRVNACVNADCVKTEAAHAAPLEDEAEAVGTIKDQENGSRSGEEDVGVACDGCRVDVDDDDEEKVQLNRDTFSRLLRRVSLTEARLYAQLCYLGSLAYSIPKIKSGNLLQQYGLQFVTSSIEKKELAAKSEEDQMSTESQEQESDGKEKKEKKAKKSNGYWISASAAHEIAASAAAYLHLRTKSIFPFKTSKVEVCECSVEGRHECSESSEIGNIPEDVASFMASTDSVTAVVAAKEEVKQAVADDLKSTISSPCEWFVCDDNESCTRFFVIQGSETLRSWQANLLFEPVKFEGMDVPVHRGIYEAAKGIYEQMLPEVQAHLKSHGDCATFRFTGHSLGGSLALLVNLMLLIREEVPVLSLLPVVTFGAPSIMCGGDNLLDRLGLPRHHVQAITMHRDIVPRAFSCNYPGHVAELLKAINGNFRNHPCLDNKKLLYAPMGELLILQPDEKFSPHHHLLPSGSGLYLMSPFFSEHNDADNYLLTAKLVFLNSPHPLEILSDRAAYGSEGTIQRDHDMKSYLKSVRSVIRQELNHIRRSKREQRRKVWWPLVLPQKSVTDVVSGRGLVSAARLEDHFNFSGILETGKQSMRRFSRLVASQHMHLFVVFMIPAKLLLLGAYSIIGLR